MINSITKFKSAIYTEDTWFSIFTDVISLINKLEVIQHMLLCFYLFSILDKEFDLSCITFIRILLANNIDKNNSKITTRGIQSIDMYIQNCILSIDSPPTVEAFTLIPAIFQSKIIIYDLEKEDSTVYDFDTDFSFTDKLNLNIIKFDGDITLIINNNHYDMLLNNNKYRMNQLYCESNYQLEEAFIEPKIESPNYLVSTNRELVFDDPYIEKNNLTPSKRESVKSETIYLSNYLTENRADAPIIESEHDRNNSKENFVRSSNKIIVQSICSSIEISKNDDFIDAKSNDYSQISDIKKSLESLDPSKREENFQQIKINESEKIPELYNKMKTLTVQGKVSEITVPKEIVEPKDVKIDMDFMNLFSEFPPKENKKVSPSKLANEKIQESDQNFIPKSTEKHLIIPITENFISSERIHDHRGSSEIKDNFLTITLPWDKKKRVIEKDKYINMVIEYNVEKPTYFVRSGAQRLLCPFTDLVITYDGFVEVIGVNRMKTLVEEIDKSIQCRCCFQ